MIASAIFLCNELWTWVYSDNEKEEDTSHKLLLQASDKFETSQLPSPVTSQSATMSLLSSMQTS